MDAPRFWALGLPNALLGQIDSGQEQAAHTRAYNSKRRWSRPPMTAIHDANASVQNPTNARTAIQKPVLVRMYESQLAVGLRFFLCVPNHYFISINTLVFAVLPLRDDRTANSSSSADYHNRYKGFAHCVRACSERTYVRMQAFCVLLCKLIVRVQLSIILVRHRACVSVR